jgi:predicted Zn-dependent peptidase
LRCLFLCWLQKTSFAPHAIERGGVGSYGVDSGGDPEAIPQLTFEQFAATHAEWYHPSNGYFWFSGNDPPLERLRLLGEHAHGRPPPAELAPSTAQLLN